MKAIGAVLGTGAVALTAIACLVLGAGDRTIFTSPPEAVVENFVRSLATKRFDPARQSLAKELQVVTDRDSLRRYAQELEAEFGTIDDVEGVPERIDGEVTQGSVDIKISDGRRTRLIFPLRCEHGLWRISQLPIRRSQ